MELRDLYTLSEIIHDSIDNNKLPKDVVNDIEIKVEFNPSTFYGVDKEFYYLTHNNSYKGFIHSQEVNAKINGVKFNIHQKTTQDKGNI